LPLNLFSQRAPKTGRHPGIHLKEKKSRAVERSTIRRVSFEREKCWNRLDLVGFHGIFQWISWDVVRFFVRFHGLTVMYFMGLNGIMINQRTGHGSSWAMAAMLQLC
jgi:hypothetical protein